MNTFFLPPWRVTEIEVGQDDVLSFRRGRIRQTTKYLYCAMLKVSDGLQYVVSQDVAELPTREDMIYDCVKKGDFALRPYYLGQQSDPCSDSCLFALVYSCCESFGIRFADLLTYTCPGVDSKGWSERYSQETVYKDAQWQGVQFPQRWTGDALTGLYLSLQQHYRPRLLDALSDAISNRGHNVDPSPPRRIT